jgi:hypothetical protein
MQTQRYIVAEAADLGDDISSLRSGYLGGCDSFSAVAEVLVNGEARNRLEIAPEVLKSVARAVRGYESMLEWLSNLRTAREWAKHELVLIAGKVGEYQRDLTALRTLCEAVEQQVDKLM